MMKGPKDVFLVCAPADAPLAIRGSVFTHLCKGCGARLMLAPDGQEILRQFPEAKTICLACFNNIEDDEGDVAMAPTENQLRALETDVISNPWRKRN